MKWIVCFLSLVLSVTSVHAGSVRLANDSPFPLIAKVSSAAGKVLGTKEVPPHQTVTWEGSWSGSSVSESPYSVRWICKEGGKDFSSCTFVGEGALVSAQTCPGANICPEKKPGTNSQKTNE